MCIQVLTIPSVKKGYLYWSFFILREYARRNGYDLYALTTKMNETRPPSWLKIRSAQAIIRSNTGCDYLFWIDGDAIIMNFSFRLENIIGYNGNKDVDVVVSGDTVAINAAMGLWKMTPWAYSFLEDMWNIGDVKLWETGAIAILIAGCKPSDPVNVKRACYEHSDKGWRNGTFAKHLKLAEPWAVQEMLVNKTLSDHMAWVPKRLINSYPKGLFGGMFDRATSPDFLAHFVAGGKNQIETWAKDSIARNKLLPDPSVPLWPPDPPNRV